MEVLNINLEGRIDSNNSEEVKAQIEAKISSFNGKLVLNAKNLDYISSAGLRVLLYFKKKFDNMSIVECKSEVYEIFEMTGFSEIIDVKKVFRNIDVTGCEIIGEGANGIVYRTDKDTIVKVYKDGVELSYIENERNLARKAFVMGIPTAIPYDVVNVSGRYGSVFELLNAKSFQQLLIEDLSNESIIKYAKESIDILKIIHSKTVKEGELPNKKLVYLNHANNIRKYYSDKIGDTIFNFVNEIPNTFNIIHGDFHIKNIMRQNDENLLIDMDTLSYGNPIFEFVGLFLTYVGFGSVNKEIIKNFLGIDSKKARLFYDTSINYYFSGKSEAFILDAKKKIEFLAYVRLVSRNQEKDLTNPDNKALLDYSIKYVEDNFLKIENLVIDF